MQVLQKIIHLCLALLLLVTTSGITINKHYCLGFLKDVSLLHHASSCMSSMDLQEEDCPMECCEETSEQILVDDFQKISYKISLIPALKLLISISYLFSDFSLDSQSANLVHYLNYLPPLIEHDIPILVQSFLL